VTEAWADLHVHTVFSDGILTPEEVVRTAKAKGLAAVGIVDHDTIAGLEDAKEAGLVHGIEILPGVELSSQYEGRDIHIIGYGFDLDHINMLERLALFREKRHTRASKMVQNLNRIGVNITIEEIEDKAKSGSLGRPHMAEVLMEKGYVETFQEAFWRYLGYGSEAYEEKYKMNPAEAIRMIAEAGGLSFLAHPGPGVTDAVLLDLVKSGLDGIEIIHPKLTQSRTEHLQTVARRHKLLVCGGSDCHGGRDGQPMIGQFRVPYAIVEDIKHRLNETRSGPSPT
jgi:3',5'-nucleoside bisphosphate phosphatase